MKLAPTSWFCATDNCLDLTYLRSSENICLVGETRTSSFTVFSACAAACTENSVCVLQLKTLCVACICATAMRATALLETERTRCDGAPHCLNGRAAVLMQHIRNVALAAGLHCMKGGTRRLPRYALRA